jgi:hypothetical protein
MIIKWYNIDEKRKFYDTLQRIKLKAGISAGEG